MWWFFLLNVVLAAIPVAQDFHPNRYLAYMIIWVRLYAAFMAVCALTMLFCLRSGVRTRSNTNIALNFTTPKKGWKKVLVFTHRALILAAAITYVIIRQPFLAIMLWSIIALVLESKRAAKKFMSGVRFNPQTGAAVIEVN